MRLPSATLVVVTVLLSAGCGSNSELSPEQTTGSSPILVAPSVERLPTLAAAGVRRWPSDASPAVAPGLRVSRYADGLSHPRTLLQLPNGDVLVAETNTPAQPGKNSIKDWIEKWVQRYAGAGATSADRLVLLRDADGDGKAESQYVFIDGLRSPFGMTYLAPWIYVACTDAVIRIRYLDGMLRAAGTPARVTELPAGSINYHWARSLAADPAGGRLFIGVGSNSNFGERGLALEDGRAMIWEFTLGTGRLRSYATGLRNPTSLLWDGSSGQLWATVAERDALGGDLVPDFLTRVQEGGFYGWPYSYFGSHRDPRVQDTRPDLVARAIVPDYALGAHATPLSVAMIDGGSFGFSSQGFVVARHGSWNRRPKSGYDIVFVPLVDGQPTGRPQTILSGFLWADGRVRGRPAGIAVDRTGGLLVADDVGGTIWRVTPTPGPP